MESRGGEASPQLFPVGWKEVSMTEPSQMWEVGRLEVQASKRWKKEDRVQEAVSGLLQWGWRSVHLRLAEFEQPMEHPETGIGQKPAQFSLS